VITYFIHTHGRHDDQQSLKRLSPSVRKRTWLVVQKREKSLYNYRPLLVLPDKIRMLSPTRQRILEYARRKDLNKIVMMDDDLAFYRRKSVKDWHLRYCKNRDINDLDELLDGWLDDFAHVGVSIREGNNRVSELHQDVSRMIRLLGYNIPEVFSVGARFDRLDTKQDLDMTLQLLRAGYPNRISFEFAQGQWHGSQSSGGCSEYRTEEMMARCSHELAALHPEFVKVVNKKTKGAWKDFGGKVVDVRIKWKKAFESGSASSSGLL